MHLGDHADVILARRELRRSATIRRPRVARQFAAAGLIVYVVLREAIA
jgi:hypothetical protein